MQPPNQMGNRQPARGVRFAPSPTGRFHVGNLRTAWISERIARSLGEPWVLRFEDIDGPRVVAGARELQLSDMAAIGLTPDESILQSSRRERHYSLLLKAIASEKVYACTCSRKDVQDAIGALASAPHGSLPIYSGHCRSLRGKLAGPGAGGVAWRFRGSELSGSQDFIVARTSGVDADPETFVPAYHWACAIDDHDGKYRVLVRASDLATSTPLQREIHAWVSATENSGYAPASVFHTSLVTRNDGHRLEKRTAGVTLPELLSSGFTAEEILRRFDASFRLPSAEIFPASILGEPDREITLASLGF